MARTVRTVTDTADLTPIQRGQRVGRPSERRIGTRAAVIRAELVEGFRAWRESAELAAEAATNGYATELAQYWQENTRPTFRAYLMHR